MFDYRYPQTSNISRTLALVGNKMVDQSDVVGAEQSSNDIFILDLTPGFSELDKDHCNTIGETPNVWYFMRLY